ncbi:MAG: hypothetical protein LC751_13740 [Actinobacteria bacterium]|nr:hypothetical protein [Actinomycetota bacterium]
MPATLLEEVADQKEVVASLAFIRWCGLAAIVGGAASVSLYVLGALYIYLYSPSSEEDIPTGLNYIEPLFLLLLLVGALSAIAGVHALQRERYGLWGAVASLLAFVGVAILIFGWLVDLLAEQRYPAVANVLIAGVLVATVGIVGLGSATIGARVLPWWCGILIFLGSPPVGFLLGPLIGVAWALVGYMLIRRARISPETLYG